MKISARNQPKGSILDVVKGATTSAIAVIKAKGMNPG